MIKVYLDSANLDEITKWEPQVDGFTTNPTLMRKAGVQDYATFAHEALARVHGKPISFEVVTESRLMDEARVIASWGENVYVKVPIVNTSGRLNLEPIQTLIHEGIPVNVTGIVNPALIWELKHISVVSTIISVFAGRMMDAGTMPCSPPKDIKGKFLWASTREPYNILQAERMGYHIVTVTPEILAKRRLLGKSLHDYTLETVCQFYEDAREAGYELLSTPGLDTPAATMLDSSLTEEGPTP